MNLNAIKENGNDSISFVCISHFFGIGGLDNVLEGVTYGKIDVRLLEAYTCILHT